MSVMLTDKPVDAMAITGIAGGRSVRRWTDYTAAVRLSMRQMSPGFQW
ncbi:MAG: hypothetical protein GIKADHBN_01294 [Phycisphaerales bacterium]|nr:hypothetical protein [Phycisphaerales bacterium]